MDSEYDAKLFKKNARIKMSKIEFYTIPFKMVYSRALLHIFEYFHILIAQLKIKYLLNN